MADGNLRYKNAAPVAIVGIEDVESLSTGYYHSAALVRGGKCFVWGCNEQSQLGPPGAGVQILSPTCLHELVPELCEVCIRSFEGGYGHSVLLSEDGRVFTMGNHSEGQRALDPDTDDGDLPVFSEVSDLPGPVTAVAAGSHHTLAVLHDGAVFAFGSDEYGQVSGRGAVIGEEDDQRFWRPRRVLGLPPDDPVIRVSAGICHSAAQTASGRTFLWGCGGNGQTGDPTLPESSPVVEIVLSEVVRRCGQHAI